MTCSESLFWISYADIICADDGWAIVCWFLVTSVLLVYVMKIKIDIWHIIILNSHWICIIRPAGQILATLSCDADGGHGYWGPEIGYVLFVGCQILTTLRASCVMHYWGGPWELLIHCIIHHCHTLSSCLLMFVSYYISHSSFLFVSSVCGVCLVHCQHVYVQSICAIKLMWCHLIYGIFWHMLGRELRAWTVSFFIYIYYWMTARGGKLGHYRLILGYCFSDGMAVHWNENAGFQLP